MAQAARKAKVVPIHAPTLEEMIEKAGVINAEKNKLNTAYNQIRKDILPLMPPIGETGEAQVVKGDLLFEAVLELGESTSVNTQLLLESHPDLFWRLVKIPVGELEKNVSREEFRELTTVTRNDTPTLTIRKIKEEK